MSYPHPLLLLGLLGCLLLGACGERVPPPPPDTAQTGSTSGFQWAILPPEMSKAFYVDWNQGFSAKTPDVRAALSGVLGALRAELAREDLPEYVDKEIWREMISGVLGHVPNYRCQVIGIEGEDGKRFLYLNFLHEKDFENEEAHEPGSTEKWTKEPILVNDGGDWFWQVKYVPADGSYHDLNINGEA